ncbi:MAG: methyl-accepting chemotaxis protein [Oscillospiraceae bacterium]|nr:methyl-accepting chemotaxis protein [Oscillospiraceae bacterium]
MRELILNDPSTCVGCNRCIRVCPAIGANIAYEEGENIKIKIDNDQCIACGACISACRHNSRDYVDDTERFLSDLRSGVPISLFAAPANRTNGENWGRLLTWLRQKGVRKIYDVSLGADICIWAYIRYIQRENPVSVITQPCPAIVNYITIYNHALLPYLSPAQSPMFCAAVYMRKYEGITDKLAALSPCIAKTHEFESTRCAEYNVTLKKLYEYINNNGIILPTEESGFDHAESSLGRVFSMPGGLKENIELYLGKSLRIDKSEGQNIVYKALDRFAEARTEHLPAIFDVLNCPEGCNLGTGCLHEREIFEINSIMDSERSTATQGRDKADFDAILEYYDNKLRLDDFIRSYRPALARSYTTTAEQVENAFLRLGKETESERKFDCSACGSETCLEMAEKIVCDLNIPNNCIQKARNDIHREHNTVLELSSENLKDIKWILEDISKIKGLSDEITRSVTGVNGAIDKYNKMATDIDSIAMHINIISLNASIEAARAGQYGKTFAVVAEEIRNLAKTSKNTVSETEDVTEQATEAIKGINVMIDQISVEVEKAYQNISDISEKTQEAIKKSEL